MQMIYEPCMWELIIDGRVCFVNFHTDDCDGLCEDPRDAKSSSMSASCSACSATLLSWMV